MRAFRWERETKMNTDQNLKQLLSTWRVEAEVPPRFQANVWAQIAARESARRSLWNQLAEWFTTEFCKPHLAAAVVTFSLALSVGTAYLRAQDSNATVGRQLEARYMETINPLAHGSHST